MLWAVLAIVVIVVALTRRRPGAARASNVQLRPEPTPVETDFRPATLAAPLGHQGDRQAVSVDELERRLRDADLGVVTREGATVQVQQGAAAVRLRPEDPARVVRSGLSVTATRLELLALALDALAPAVGAIEVSWNGMTLKLDGTMPRAAVERAAHLALEDHRRALERTLREPTKRPDDQLLH